jgi:hypothetical protein
MRTLRTLAPGVISALVAASPLLAHHAWPVDRTSQVTVTGTVTAFTWADPHVMIALDVQADGATEKWQLGGSNMKYMTAGGWDRNTLKPGDVITGTGYRYSDGSNVIEIRRIVLASGKELFYGSGPARTPLPAPPAADATSTGRERRP